MKLSLVIITRNREKMVKELIESMNDIKDKEIILIDNNDNHLNYTNRLAKSREDITVYRHESSRTLSAGRNLGLEKSKGKYILFIDDDDLIHEQFVKFINKYNKDYDVLRFCETHFPHKSRRRPSFSLRWLSKFDRFFLYQQSSFLYKRDFLVSKGLYFKEAYGEDRVFYADLIRVVKKQRMIHKYSIWYRNDNSGLTRKSNEELKKQQDTLIKFLKENNYVDELKRYMKDKVEINE